MLSVRFAPLPEMMVGGGRFLIGMEGGTLMAKNNGSNSMSKALVRRETMAGYAFMLPSLIFFLGFVIYPMVQCVFTSFF